VPKTERSSIRPPDISSSARTSHAVDRTCASGNGSSLRPECAISIPIDVELPR
jgi:hypothetical protein